MSNCISYSILLLILLDLTQCTVCSAAMLKFEDIARSVSVVMEENPGRVPATSTTGSPVSVDAFQTSSLQFNERISDSIATSVLRFALDVGRQLGEQSSHSRSEVFSPISIMSALSLLMLGAGGRSYHELQSVFGLDKVAEPLIKSSEFHTEFGYLLEDLQIEGHSKVSTRSRKNSNWRTTATASNIRHSDAGNGSKPVDHIIKIANGIFTHIDYNLNPSYLYASRLVYRSVLVPLDLVTKPLESRNYINRWVEDSTFGKISNIMSGEIARGTNVILASALYFKGFWENSFFAAATVQDNFYPDGMEQPSVKVKMMATGGEFPFYNSAENDCRIIGLPYKGNLTTMYIIQPNQSTRSKLKDLQLILDAPKIEEMISRMVKKSAMIALPKMHLVRSMNLRDTLNRLGVRDIFIQGVSDLSLIGGARELNAPTADRGIPSEQETRVTEVPSVPKLTLPAPELSSTPTPLHSSSTPQLTYTVSQGLPIPQAPTAFEATQTPPSSFQTTSSSPTLTSFQKFQTNSMRSPTTKYVPLDRFNEPALIFNRFGLIDSDNSSQSPLPELTNDNIDSVVHSRLKTTKRQTQEVPLIHRDASKMIYLDSLENGRLGGTQKSNLFVQDIVHKVDIEVNEQGTEAAAATLTYLRRSGTDVLFRADTPFLFLIRHDPTKLILFYGVINEPDS